MNVCTIHQIALIPMRTSYATEVCPRCVQLEKGNSEQAIGVIPFSCITPLELKLFDEAIVDGDEQVIKVDLRNLINLNSFLQCVEYRSPKYVDFDAIKEIDLLNGIIRLKE